MKLASKARYAVTALLDIALCSGERPIPLTDISARQGISLSYLEQLFSKLRKAKLVKSVRGSGGGYYLAKSTDKMIIRDIIEAVDESIKMTKCSGSGSGCRNGQKCITHNLFHGLSLRIGDFLDTITLADVMNDEYISQMKDKQNISLEKM